MQPQVLGYGEKKEKRKKEGKEVSLTGLAAGTLEYDLRFCSSFPELRVK